MSAPLLLESKLKLDSYRVMASRMDIMQRAYPKAAQAATYTAATEITDAIYANAPEDTGFLKKSAYVASKKRSAVFGFGAWYAVMVNGRKVKFRTGRARFMSSTLEEKFPTILSRLSALMSDYIRNGVTMENVPRRYPPVPIGGDGWTKARKRAVQASKLSISRAARGFGFSRSRRKRKKKAT